MTFDLRLAKKGQSEPLEGILQQGRVHAGLGNMHGEELNEWGWLPEQTAGLEKSVAVLDSLASGQKEAKETSKASTKTENAARTEAKTFIRRVRLALPMVLRDSPVEGVTAESFNAGESLGRSTPKISKYLINIRPFVQKLDEPLKRYFKGESPSAMLDAIKQSLEQADTAQEVNVTSLPQNTQAVYEAKGRILEMIEDLNRIAKIAFDGRAEIASKFNKDILLRARKSQPKQDSAS